MKNVRKLDEIREDMVLKEIQELDRIIADMETLVSTMNKANDKIRHELFLEVGQHVLKRVKFAAGGDIITRKRVKLEKQIEAKERQLKQLLGD